MNRLLDVERSLLICVDGPQTVSSLFRDKRDGTKTSFSYGFAKSSVQVHMRTFRTQVGFIVIVGGQDVLRSDYELPYNLASQTPGSGVEVALGEGSVKGRSVRGDADGA